MLIPFERSFASHPKSEYWSIKNKQKSRNTFKNSHKKIWFDKNVKPNGICFITIK